MKIAITGASGYFGELLTRRLSSDPAVSRILALDISPPRFRSEKVEYCHADLLEADFARLLEGCDAVYHLAFIVDPPRQLGAAEIDRVNVDGSRRVFEGAIAGGVSKIVFASSMAVYGAHPDNPPLLSEQMPLRPNEDWYYSRHKASVESILDELGPRCPDTAMIRFRPAILLGPTMRNHLNRLLARRTVFAFSEHKRDFVWDEDVVEAFRLALDHDRSDVFNLAGERPLTLGECAELMGRRVVRLRARTTIIGARIAAGLRLIPRGTLEWIVASARGPVLMSSAKARGSLKWRPRFDGPGAVREYAKHRPVG